MIAGGNRHKDIRRDRSIVGGGDLDGVTAAGNAYKVWNARAPVQRVAIRVRGPNGRGDESRFAGRERERRRLKGEARRIDTLAGDRDADVLELAARIVRGSIRAAGGLDGDRAAALDIAARAREHNGGEQVVKVVNVIIIGRIITVLNVEAVHSVVEVPRIGVRGQRNAEMFYKFGNILAGNGRPRLRKIAAVLRALSP